MAWFGTRSNPHQAAHRVYSPLPPLPKPLFHRQPKSTMKANLVVHRRAMCAQARICESRTLYTTTPNLPPKLARACMPSPLILVYPTAPASSIQKYDLTNPKPSHSVTILTAATALQNPTQLYNCSTIWQPSIPFPTTCPPIRPINLFQGNSNKGTLHNFNCPCKALSYPANPPPS
jgi:hypothetical protein